MVGSRWTVVLASLAILILASPTPAQQLRLQERRPDPHGSPRPFRNAQNVPLATSLYVELSSADPAERLDPAKLSVELWQNGKRVRKLLEPGQKFVAPATGWIRPRQGLAGAELKRVDQVGLYIEPNMRLEPATRYEVRIDTPPPDKGYTTTVSWSFTTEGEPTQHRVVQRLDLSQPPVHWHGRFFSGLCNVVFCTQDEHFGPTYALMDEARQRHPRAWTNQRDFWMTGFEYRKPGLMPVRLPNIVRERETSRITGMEPDKDGVRLTVEDFFGHEQYGIKSGRPLSDDYHAGDEVLIADGVSDALARVIAVDDQARTVLVAKFKEPETGWKLEYEGPLPTEEDPDAPGLFPPGGCYLRKFAPHGTPCYYWGRLDKEWDLLHRKHGRRLFVNFADAAGDLSVDGRSWTTAKDYAQWHAVVREISGQLIDRYGEDSLTFTWSVFNEPDLGPIFWRTSWDELQRFYDYTVDGVLRAFEDRGYDSSQVFIGGLELGGIFGPNLRLREFLAHCSPTAKSQGALPLNAAYADERLEGKRSRRVEELCRAHGGKGTPCDFVSIHAYNNSQVMDAKLARAKEMALEIDADYYARLWVNSHEACPEWNPPPDEAAADSYLGNGYFPTWCVDLASRQLDRAADDPRYAFGETLLTVWPPPHDLTGTNAITRVLNCDDDGDGKADRQVTIANPVFHALNLLSDMGDDYWLLKRRDLAGHVVSGFASRDEQGVVRLALFSHQLEDTQSRSTARFEVELSLSGKGIAAGEQMQLTEYRFDAEHNSYLEQVRELREAATGETSRSAAADALARRLAEDDLETQLAALGEVKTLKPAEQFALLTAVARLSDGSKDQRVRDTASEIIKAVFFSRPGQRAGLPRDVVEDLKQRSQLRPTRTGATTPDDRGQLTLKAELQANCLTFLVLEPQKSE